MVESQPSKLLVAGSIPVSRSMLSKECSEKVGFQQAVIRIDREKEFEELKGAIDRVFSAEKVERFLKQLHGERVRVRDWESVLDKGVLERTDHPGATGGETARGLYGKLTISDQAQIRELYLFRVEEVDPKLRARFHKIYQYY